MYKMDIFREHIVKHKLEVKDALIQVGACFLAMLLTILILPFIFGQLSFIALFLIAGVWYGAYWIIRSRSVEYEYIMTNSSLDIDKIMARSKRKRIASLDLKEIDILASVEHDAFSNQGALLKTHDCTGDGKTDVYFIDYSAEKGKERILFQPTERMLEDAYKFNPSKIIVKR